MKFGSMAVSEAMGAVLAHSVRHDGSLFKKGRVLSESDIGVLQAAGIDKVIAARLDENDVAEDEAASAVARAVAGPGVTVAEPFTGRANLYADAHGLALVDVDLLHELNLLDESLTLATVPDFQVVEPRQMLATVKIIPFAVQTKVLEKALELCGAGGIVKIAPFEAHKCGLVLTELPQTRVQILEKSRQAIMVRLERCGSTLEGVERCAHSADTVAGAIGRLTDKGLSPILVFGASAIVDRGDVIPQGLLAAGGEVVHLGMPVDPGNLMMLGRLGGGAVIGVPSCARSPKINGFDWVLQRVLAGVPVTAQDVMRMGAGGLLKEIPSRPTPRGQPVPGGPRAPAIAGIVLAAGQSRRMGRVNKLLADVDGRPMLARVLDAVTQSAADPVIVVVGHESEQVRAALAGYDVTFVDNPDFDDGLSTSLNAGIAALPDGVDGAIVCLGDMPMVAAHHVNRLISAFDVEEGRTICVPVARGKRGNPVLWGADYFDDMVAIKGDVGAKYLLGQYAEAVCEVAIGDDAVLTDIDTPGALKSLSKS